MKRLFLPLAAVFLCAPSIASAQFSSGRLHNQNANAIRVTAQFQTVIPMQAATEAERETAKTRARAKLYELAQRECEVLTGVFSGECKIVSVNVNLTEQNPFAAMNMPGASVVRININASYTIAPKE